MGCRLSPKVSEQWDSSNADLPEVSGCLTGSDSPPAGRPSGGAPRPGIEHPRCHRVVSGMQSLRPRALSKNGSPPVRDRLVPSKLSVECSRAKGPSGPFCASAPLPRVQLSSLHEDRDFSQGRATRLVRAPRTNASRVLKPSNSPTDQAQCRRLHRRRCLLHVRVDSLSGLPRLQGRTDPQPDDRVQK